MLPLILLAGCSLSPQLDSNTPIQEALKLKGKHEPIHKCGIDGDSYRRIFLEETVADNPYNFVGIGYREAGSNSAVTIALAKIYKNGVSFRILQDGKGGRIDGIVDTSLNTFANADKARQLAQLFRNGNDCEIADSFNHLEPTEPTLEDQAIYDAVKELSRK